MLNEKHRSLLSFPVFGWFLHDNIRSRQARKVVCVVSVAFVAVMVGVFVAARSSPDWWASVERVSERASIEAEQLENAVVRSASLIRPAGKSAPESGLTYMSDEWDIEIGEQQANAWISTRLAMWLMNRGESEQLADSTGKVRVMFRNSKLWAGAPSQDYRNTLLWASMTVGFDRADGIVLSELSPHVGCLPVPESFISLLGRTSAVGNVPKFHDGVLKIEVPVIKLQDGRRVRLLGCSIEDNVVRLFCRTEK